ncbi:hypothetical protein [Ferruginibacter profundus]
MSNEKFAEIASNCIGLGLMIASIGVIRNNQQLTEKKVFGFPLLKLNYLLVGFFIVMIVVAILK